MHIKAVVPASVIEYPEHIADVLYVGACNFRCPYCYNVDLVMRPEELPDLDPAAVLRGLETRRGFVDGVVVSGGEPTLQPDLVPFLGQISALGLAVKLDTNGTRPDVLSDCLERQIVDYVAMDIKSSIGKYEAAAGVPVDRKRLQRSIRVLLCSHIDYEFRTTVVPSLVGTSDVQAILKLIAGARRYYLQSFRPGWTVGWGREAPVGAPAPELLDEMAVMAKDCVQEVGIRGLPPAGGIDAYPS